MKILILKSIVNIVIFTEITATWQYFYLQSYFFETPFIIITTGIFIRIQKE